MKKAILVAIGMCAFVAGCKDSGSKSAGIPVEPKWKGAPYHLAFDTKVDKPNPTGITIPTIKYTANPDALETRVTLAVRIDDSNVKPMINQMIMHPVDISGAEGALPADYMKDADKNLDTLLKAYCVKGKVKIKVALVRSSINPQAGDAELNAKRLSDWTPTEVESKSHGKC